MQKVFPLVCFADPSCPFSVIIYNLKQIYAVVDVEAIQNDHEVHIPGPGVVNT